MAGVVPCTAPLALLFGSIGYLTHRPTVARLPSTHRALSILGLVAALVSTVLLVLAFWVHGVASLLAS